MTSLPDPSDRNELSRDQPYTKIANGHQNFLARKAQIQWMRRVKDLMSIRGAVQYYRSHFVDK